jgi:hypothetical protein
MLLFSSMSQSSSDCSIQQRTLVSAQRMLRAWTLGGSLFWMYSDCKMLILVKKNTCLVTTNDEQRCIRRVESACVKLVPAAVEFLHAVLAAGIQRPYFYCVFTGRDKIFARGAPAQWIDVPCVALQIYQQKSNGWVIFQTSEIRLQLHQPPGD